MSDLITAQVAKIVHKALATYAEDLTLSHGGTIESDGAGGWQEATLTDVAGLGFVDQFTASERMNGVPDNARKIIILSESIAQEPVPQDKITIRGETFEVISVDKDPAQATYVCVVK